MAGTDDFLKSLGRNQLDTYRNSTEGMAEIDGVTGMDKTSAAFVRGLQKNFGSGGGDVGRAIVQAPSTVLGGVLGGAQSFGGGAYQALGDGLEMIGLENNWAQKQAAYNHAQVQAKQQAAAQNYQTSVGRDVGSGLYSTGATAPLTLASIASRNPAYMTGGAGVQTAADTYVADRQDGATVIPSLLNAIGQGSAEVLGEALPAQALVGMAARGINPGRLGSYALGELGGEAATGLVQDATGTAVHNNNAQGWQGFNERIPDTIQSSVIGGAVQGGVNLGMIPVTNAARDVVQSFRQQPQQPSTLNQANQAVGAANSTAAFMAKLGAGAAAQAQQPQPQPQASVQPQQQTPVNPKAQSSLMASLQEMTKPNSIFKTRTDVPTVQQLTGQQPKPQAPVKPPQEVSGNQAVQNTVNKIIGVESGGKANNPNPSSSANGLGQFIDSTWLAMVKKYRPDVANGKSRGQILALKTNPSLGREMTERYVQENAGILRKAGLPVTEGNLYLAHFSGPETAARVLKGNPNAPASSVYGADAINANKSILQGKTLGQVAAWANRKMGGKAAANYQGDQAYVDGGDMAAPVESPLADTSMFDDNSGNESMLDAAQAQREAAEEMQDVARKLGKQTTVRIGDEKADADMMLIDALDLSPSVAGTENQYRDRNRAASQIQVNKIANELDPEILGDSKLIDTGAPTLAADGKTIIGGNGRTMGILQAYEQGNGQQYKDYIANHAADFGINAADVLGMERPVLVRRLRDGGIDVGKASIASNENSGLAMSALEQARVDSGRLPNFGSLQFADDGNLNIPANRGFIRDFVGQMPTTMQAQMVDAGGNLSQDGYRRMQNAILHRAYGNTPALSRMVEATDQGTRNLLTAMMKSAPKIAAAKDAIQAGNMHDADIGNDLVGAVETINQLRTEGRSVADYLAQQGMFAEDLSPVARELVAFLDDNIRSAKKISELIEAYYDVLAEQGSPNQDDIFSGNAAPTKEQIYAAAKQQHSKRNAESEQSGIFDQPTERSAEQPADERTGESSQESEQQPSSTERDGESVGESVGESESEVTAKAPNYIHLNERQLNQIRTPEFKKWFGDWEHDAANASKVVNPKTGEPLVMFHGTSHGAHDGDAFTMFDTYASNYGLMGMGGYFTANSDVASSYTTKGKGQNPSVYPVFLSIKNPIDMDAPAKFHIWHEAFAEFGVVHEHIADDVDNATNEDMYRAAENLLSQQHFSSDEGAEIMQEKLIGMGFDGITHVGGGRFKKGDNLKHRVFIAFDPNQIKSAIGNTGKFDSDSTDIRYSRSNQDAIQSKITDIETAIQDAVGDLAQHIEVVSAYDMFPADVAKSYIDGNAEGAYFPKDRKIYILAESVTPERARWVAWHELGHRGFDTPQFKNYQSLVTQARNNPVVDALSKAIMKDRKQYADDRAGSDINVATEEAIVELFAASKTGNYAEIEKRYGVKAIQPEFKTTLQRLLDKFKALMGKVTGRNVAEFSNDDVLDLLRAVEMAAAEEAQVGRDGEAKLSRAKESISNFIDRVIEDKTLREQLNVLDVTDAEVAIAQANGMDISNYLHMIDSSAVNHILKNHGNAQKEQQRGQIAITKSDFESVPDVIANPDKTIFGTKNNVGREQIVYLKKMQDGSLLMIEEQRTGRKKLALHTMRKYPATTDDSSIERTLLSNAQGDSGNELSIVNHLEDGNKNSDFTPNNNDIHFSRKQQRSWRNEMGELSAGVAAYQYIADNLSPLLARIGFARSTPTFTKYMREYRAMLNASGTTAKEMSEQMKVMSDADRKLLSDVIELEVPQGVAVPLELQDMADAIRAVFNQQSDDLVALDMLAPETANRWRDTYLPRIYNKHADMLSDLGKIQAEFRKDMRKGMGTAIKGNHLKGRGIFKEVPIKTREYWESQGFEVREDKGNGKLLMWRDYSREEREQMNEERDAGLRFATGYVKTQADIAKGMLFKRIATDGELASNTKLAENWVHVPDSTIDGTGGVKKYGALAGMYVHPEVFADLQRSFFMDNVAFKIWMKALGWWKMTKTVEPVPNFV